MNQIEKQYFMEMGSLDAVSYFQALVQEGCRLSLISPSQLETLQSRLMELIVRQLNRWTGGQSSSVPADTGQQIQQSVLYTIGYHLKKLSEGEAAGSESTGAGSEAAQMETTGAGSEAAGSEATGAGSETAIARAAGPEAALEALAGQSPEDLFLTGKQLIEKDLREARQLLRRLQENCLSTDLLAYNHTLKSGLPAFFTSYDMDYAAHETPASVDYPLAADQMNLTGIDYICEYLRKLQLENEFCSRFSGEEIHRLLRGYDRQYKDLLFNIFNLVLANAAGCLLLGRSLDQLSISEYDRQYLQKELAPLSRERLDELLDQTLLRLCGLLAISNDRLRDYIRISAADLKSRFKSALESDSLQSLLLSAREDVSAPFLQFEDKGKLNQDRFRRLADEIRQCRFISDKLALLQREQPGFTDLADLLEGDCFFGEEYEEVFRSLDEVRLALLMKKLPLDPADASFLAEESHKEWQDSFYRYLEGMDPQRKKAIRALADRISL